MNKTGLKKIPVPKVGKQVISNSRVLIRVKRNRHPLVNCTCWRVFVKIPPGKEVKELMEKEGVKLRA